MATETVSEHATDDRPCATPPATVEDVRRFWDANPLWAGASQYDVGTREFFDEHSRVVIDDCFAGRFDERTIPAPDKRRRVLDLGCGPGFWTVELGRRGCQNIVAADLTPRAVELARQRCKHFAITADFRLENAESLSFPDASFSHVNCQGVIHHTPNTEACVQEIARVLEFGGTASISVYYRNVIIRTWPVLGWAGNLASLAGAKLRGRGRENLYCIRDVVDLVRRFDGAENPIGRAFTRGQFLAMLEPHFRVEQTYLHFFPARSLPIRIPQRIHRALDHCAGFMIYASLQKR